MTSVTLLPSLVVPLQISLVFLPSSAMDSSIDSRGFMVHSMQAGIVDSIPLIANFASVDAKKVGQ